MSEALLIPAVDVLEVLTSPPAQLFPRLVLSSQVTWIDQRNGESLSLPLLPHARFLKTFEQPWLRKLTLTGEWRDPLEGCWLAECSAFILVNEEGQWRQTIPTQGEREAAEQAVVELSVGSAVMEVPPGDHCRLSPVGGRWAEPLQVRCRKGQARVTVAVFPR